MITYPRLIDELADRDRDEFARAAGVLPETLQAIEAGGIAPSFSIRDRLARALDVNPIELFRLDADLEEALAGAPSRYVTDPATLRTIDRPRSA